MLDAEVGHRGWREQSLDAKVGHRWMHWTCRGLTQRLEAEVGHSGGTQRLDTEVGRRGWMQRLDAEVGCNV